MVINKIMLSSLTLNHSLIFRNWPLIFSLFRDCECDVVLQAVGVATTDILQAIIIPPFVTLLLSTRDKHCFCRPSHVVLSPLRARECNVLLQAAVLATTNLLTPRRCRSPASALRLSPVGSAMSALATHPAPAVTSSSRRRPSSILQLAATMSSLATPPVS
ncbi:hypothetical protein PIB30_017688 [Stylosanthes scabra]|uniref:Uncharacterized protein n=1 Tax=Stylosanthes scabra TaxID=79078 RepID=A0ABU6Z553_9FABA|nr:hypothetical protein [Stylosanthes scabra]